MVMAANSSTIAAAVPARIPLLPEGALPVCRPAPHSSKPFCGAYALAFARANCTALADAIVQKDSGLLVCCVLEMALVAFTILGSNSCRTARAKVKRQGRAGQGRMDANTPHYQ